MPFLKRLTERWITFTISEKCYSVAIALLFVTTLLDIYGVLKQDALLKFFCFLFPTLVSAFGFYCWAKPIVSKAEKNLLLKYLSYFIRACLAILSIAWAKDIVGSATQLPSSDYSLTVTAIAIITTFFSWTYAFCIFLMFLALIFVMPGLVFSLVGIYTLSVNQTNKHSEWMKKKTDQLALHGVGVFIFSIGILLIVSPIESFVRQNLQYVRLLAFALDYQQPNLYPGLTSNKRFLLHNNGVVSYIERSGWETKITIDKIRQQ